MRAGVLPQRATWPASSLRGLQELTDSGYRSRAGFTAIAKVENEAGVAHGFTTETGWWNVHKAQELPYFSQ
jgi:hypothetical protein